MSTVLDVAPRPAAADSRRVWVAALWGLLLAKTIAGWGVQWDIRWHLVIGRDSFWIAPHVMTYAGVTLITVISLAVLARDTWRARHGGVPPGTVRVFGLVGTPGFHLAWWGIALTILAAPIDDLWHRLFGIDVTLWSSPHLLGLLGAQVNSVACLLIALELWPAESAGRRAALLVTGALLLGAFYITVDPGVQTAFRRGGVFFYVWAILAAAALAFTHVLVSRLGDMRWAPVWLATGAAVLYVLGIGIGDAGFTVLGPVPALEEALADPDSPVAIAHEMARRNGARAPGRAYLHRVWPILPALLVASVDGRRWWAMASLALGAGVLALSGVLFARMPALAHALPSTADTAVGAALTLLAALTGGAAAVRLAAAFSPAPASSPAPGTPPLASRSPSPVSPISSASPRSSPRAPSSPAPRTSSPV